MTLYFWGPGRSSVPLKEAADNFWGVLKCPLGSLVLPITGAFPHYFRLYEAGSSRRPLVASTGGGQRVSMVLPVFTHNWPEVLVIVSSFSPLVPGQRKAFDLFWYLFVNKRTF